MAEGWFFPHPINLNNVIPNNLEKLIDSKSLWMYIKQTNKSSVVHSIKNTYKSKEDIFISINTVLFSCLFIGK